MKLIPKPDAEKKTELERLLAKGTVMIFVDTRRSGVSVPEKHKDLPQLALNLSYTFQIPDFEVTDSQVQVTLTFPDGKHFCVVPMPALYGMTSRFTGETVVFPESVPAEFLTPEIQAAIESSKKTGEDAASAVLMPDKKMSPIREVIEGQPDEAKKDAPPAEEKKKKRGHLRLVQAEDEK